MSDKIGKYEVLERIGGATVGTVYKAKDPRLSRLVAIRSITPEGGITDELRERFFREAQVCAGLSHPGIVTIYDVDEQGDRLYLVMELLDGRTLAELVSERADLSLEQKVAAMAQLCGALQYVQGKGIADPRLEPAHLVLQRDGSVKILDLAIAQLEGPVAPATMRYPSPEHAGGKADALSGQFSLGSLFYEMVTGKAPYEGDGAARLAAVKDKAPAALLQVNPDLPADLAKIIDKAMSKGPAGRYADLGALRSDLEAVAKTIDDEVAPLREKVAALVAERESLEAAVVQRLGTKPADKTDDTVRPAVHLEALRRRARETEAVLAELRAKTAKLDALDAVVRRGNELLEAGKFAGARVEFEAVLAELPEFAAVTAALEKARTGEELEKRRQQATKLVDDARKAFGEKECERCLGFLQQAEAVPPPDDMVAAIHALREDARKLLAELEAKRRARQQAEGAKAVAVEAKKHTADQGAAKYAADHWKKAEEKLKAGDKQFADEKYSEAFQTWEAAVEAYKAADDETRAAKERERRAAEEAEAAHRLKLTNEILAEARTAFAERAYLRCQDILKRTLDIPPPEQSAEEIRKLNDEAETALATERRAKTPAQTARLLMTETRSDAQAEGADARATKAWTDAEEMASKGAAAFAAELFSTANDAFQEAAKSFRLALDEAREAKLRATDEAEEAKREAEARDRRQMVDRFLTEARSAIERGDHALGLDVLDTAAKVSSAADVQDEIAKLRSAAENAKRHKEEAEQARQAEIVERQKAEKARELVIEAVRDLHGQSAAEVSTSLWDEVEAKVGQAHAAFARGNYGAAFAAYEAGLVLCQLCADAVRAAVAREQAGAEAAKVNPLAAAAAQVAQRGRPPRQNGDGEAPRPQAKAAEPANEAAKPVEAAPAKPVEAAPPADPAPVDPRLEAAAAAAWEPRVVPSPYPNLPTEPPPRVEMPSVLMPSRAERQAGIRPKNRNVANDDLVELAPRRLSPVMLLGVVAVAAALAYAFIQFELHLARPDSKAAATSASPVAVAEQTGAGGAAAEQAKFDAAATAAADAKAAAEAKVVADAKAAADAKSAAEAKALADAKAAEEAKIAAEVKAGEEAKAAAAAKAEADAKALQAKTEADAKAAATAKTEEAKAAKAKILADAKAAAKVATGADDAATSDGKPLFVKAYASVFVEPTDGNRSGGAWGACWRADASAARACAKASCDSTRRTNAGCSETATTQPGGHCAVASAGKFGISTGACAATRAEAESAANASCTKQLNRRYPASGGACRVAWSTDPR